MIIVALVAIAVNAAPTKLAKLGDSSVKVEKQEKVLCMLKQNVNKHVVRPEQASQEKTFAAGKRYALPAMQKAAAADIVLNGEGFLVGPEYEAATGEWLLHWRRKDILSVCAGTARKITIVVLIPSMISVWNILGDGINRQICSMRFTSRMLR